MGMNITREPYFQREDANLESLRWNAYLDGLVADGFRIEPDPNPVVGHRQPKTQWSILGPFEKMQTPGTAELTKDLTGDITGFSER